MRIYICFFLLFLSFVSYSQQEIKTTGLAMYTYNLYNPGAAGVRRNATFGALSRAQWVGVKGAPVYSTLYAHLPWKENNGIGGTLNYYSVGARKSTSLEGDYSYKILLSAKGNGLVLSLGAKISMEYSSFGDINSFDNLQSHSLSVINLGSVFSTNFGVGGFLYSDKYYVSFSTLQLFDLALYKETDYKREINPVNFFGGGYIQTLNHRIIDKIRYDVLLRHFVYGNNLNVNINASVSIIDMLWLGLSIRLGNMDQVGDIGIVSMINLTKEFKLMYSYRNPIERGVSDISRLGTHEILLTYNIFLRKSGKRYK